MKLSVNKTLNIFTTIYLVFTFLRSWKIIHKMMCWKSEGRTYIQAWRIVHPIGRAQAHKTSETCPNFWVCAFGLVKTKKLIDLQVFSRIGKTMKKLYKFQIQTRNQHTCNTLMFAYRQVLKLPYLLMNWEAFNQFPALKRVRGVSKLFRRPSW